MHAGDGPYGFSLTLSCTGTSSCGAPYGAMPRSSSRSGGNPTSAPEPDTDGGAVAGEVLGLGQGDDVVGYLSEGVAGVVDDVDGLGERAHREPAAVAGAAGRGQHVVGAGAVVTETHRGVRPDEDGAGVAHPGRPGRGVLGL